MELFDFQTGLDIVLDILELTTVFNYKLAMVKGSIISLLFTKTDIIQTTKTAQEELSVIPWAIIAALSLCVLTTWVREVVYSTANWVDRRYSISPSVY
jgi:hypothetical protein